MFVRNGISHLSHQAVPIENPFDIPDIYSFFDFNRIAVAILSNYHMLFFLNLNFILFNSISLSENSICV